MPVLKNARHERFAQEIAKGKSQVEAYALAGFGRSTSRPAALAKDRRILARVSEIRAARERIEEKAAERVLEHATEDLALTRESIIEMLIVDRALAHKQGQAAAAIKAAELLGKELFHMFIDRREQGGPGDFDNLSREQVEQRLVDNMVGRGMSERAARALLRRGAANDADAA